tara:strand:+ start:202 stop:1092 length:891 start_codon:yes stop_codon:yes gene_type:complete
MSCNTADINSDIINECDLKCKLVTDYPSQGIQCTGYNKLDKVALQLSIDGIENLNSELNFTPYTSVAIFVVQPSLHRYSGRKVAAEMIIISKSRETGKYLFICIPIIEGNSSSDLDDIIHKAGMSPAQESTFDLNNFVPQHPYYSYTGGLNYGYGCSDITSEIIVFQKRHALRLLEENLSIIPETQISFGINDVDSISFSKNKPLKSQNDASFPITCEPYDDPDMEPEIEKKKFRSPFTMSDKDFQEWSSNVAIQIIIGALVLYILVKFLFLITSLGSKKADISSMDGGSLIMRHS